MQYKICNEDWLAPKINIILSHVPQAVVLHNLVNACMQTPLKWPSLVAPPDNIKLIELLHFLFCCRILFRMTYWYLNFLTTKAVSNGFFSWVKKNFLVHKGILQKNEAFKLHSADFENLLSKSALLCALKRLLNELQWNEL